MTMHDRARGFTLMEVMIALVIVSLGLAAITVSLSQHADNSRKLTDMTLAAFIAGNSLTALRLSGNFPDVGRTTEEIEYANRDWIVTTVVQESGITGLRRADVSVADSGNPDRTVRTMTGFVSGIQSMPGGQRPAYAGL